MILNVDVAWFGRKGRKTASSTEAESAAEATEGSGAFDGLANMLEPEADDPLEAERTRIQTLPDAALAAVPPPPVSSTASKRFTPRPSSSPPASRIRPPSPPPIAPPGRARTRSPAVADDSERTRIHQNVGSSDDEATRIQLPTHEASAVGSDEEATRIRLPTDDDDEATRMLSSSALNDGAVDRPDPEKTHIHKTGSHAALSLVAKRPEQPKRKKPSKHGAKAKSEPKDEPLPQGTMVGRYLLTQRIGMGGMGSVYAAYDPELDRKVAVKLLHAEPGSGSSGASSRGRLLREAQAMAKLSHPAVVTVHDVGLFERQVFVAMEYVEGGTLRDWMRGHKRPWRETLEIFLQAGEGLAAAHAAGLIHRDFKPSNVVISTDGRARVLDFGLARRTEGDDEKSAQGSAGPLDRVEGELSISVSASRSSLDMHLTQAGAIMGSPAYMSPEQHMSRETDPRSDQFSFCVSLFEALYGERPFISEDHRTLVYAILEQRIRPVPRDTRVPKTIHRAILRGLAANPSDRYPSMAELLADLRRDPGRSMRRWVGVLAIALAIAGGAFVMWPKEVTDDALAQVDGLATTAREAAARSLFVYPSAHQPDQKTAYTHVLELEQLEKEIGKIAKTRAKELREEFAETLIYLGDRYWDQEGGKPFAIDYYAQALVFDDSNAHARERASLTVGQLADLRRKADEADFSEHEIAAAEPLAALAETDERKREERLAALLDAPEQAGRSASTEAQLERLLSSQRKAESKPKPQATRTSLPAQPASGTPGVAPSGEDAQAAPQPGERTATKQKHDPKLARELAEQGQAALQSADFKEASRLFHRALSFDRNCTAALIGLSDMHFEKAERAQAIEYAQRAVAVAPKNAGYKIKLGDAYFKALRYHDAKAEYEAAEKLGDGRAKSRLEKIAQTLGE